MAKRPTTNRRRAATTSADGGLAINQAIALNHLLETGINLRNRIFGQLIDPRRNIDSECGYPDDITAETYRFMYDRGGLAKRVVSVYPEECWAMPPWIYETEDLDDTTEFEKAWKELDKKHGILSYLGRADEISGIGHYGLILFGLDDGRDLKEPVEGLDETTGQIAPGSHELLFIRTFDESLVEIDTFETDIYNPRYGQPKTYQVTFVDPRNDRGVGTGRDLTRRVVHWSRVLHVADNCINSEVYGTPRMRSVFNYLCDIRKVLGGSGEMFWKGGFPGFSFETNPDMGDAEIDKESLRAEFDDYQNGLTRFLATVGMTVKTMTPQVASPEEHFKAQLHAIAITLGVPLRVFIGSEEAKLSSTQDAKTWNKRLARRQNGYLTSKLVRPAIDRLIAYGCLPPVEDYVVEWPDLNTSTDEEKANTAAKRATALATYVGSGSEIVCPPLEFFIHVLGYPDDVARQIVESAEEHTLTTDLAFAPPPAAAPAAPGGSSDREGSDDIPNGTGKKPNKQAKVKRAANPKPTKKAVRGRGIGNGTGQ